MSFFFFLLPHDNWWNFGREQELNDTQKRSCHKVSFFEKENDIHLRANGNNRIKVVPELVHVIFRKLPKEFNFELMGLLQCTSRDGINKKGFRICKIFTAKMNECTHVFCEFGNWVGVHVRVGGWMCESACEGISGNGFCREGRETVVQSKSVWGKWFSGRESNRYGRGSEKQHRNLGVSEAVG